MSRRSGRQAPRAALVLLAAGSGSRVGADTNKVLLPLAGRRVLTWSLTWTERAEWCTRTVVVVREQDRGEVEQVLRREAPRRRVDVVAGGDSRHASEHNALQVLADDVRAGLVDVVVIHDAARPLTGRATFDEVVRTADVLGGALPVLRQPALVPVDGPAGEASAEHASRATANSVVDSAAERAVAHPEDLVTVQTPQAFRALPLLEAYEAAATEGFTGTDTAACVERYGDTAVRGLPGRATNIKVTFPEDLFLAERILAMNRWHMP